IKNPDTRRRIYRTLAADPRARLTLAVAVDVIVGRAVVAPSFGRWQALPRVREFAIEVARECRHLGIAARLTRAALSDPAGESEIVVAFPLPSAWDAEYERLPPAQYGHLLAAGARRYGFRPTGTDEPELRWQPGGALLVRRGARVPAKTLTAFE